jgi:hypothetical protein
VNGRAAFNSIRTALVRPVGVLGWRCCWLLLMSDSSSPPPPSSSSLWLLSIAASVVTCLFPHLLLLKSGKGRAKKRIIHPSSEQSPAQFLISFPLPLCHPSILQHSLHWANCFSLLGKSNPPGKAGKRAMSQQNRAEQQQQQGFAVSLNQRPRGTGIAHWRLDPGRGWGWLDTKVNQSESVSCCSSEREGPSSRFLANKSEARLPHIWLMNSAYSLKPSGPLHLAAGCAYPLQITSDLDSTRNCWMVRRLYVGQTKGEMGQLKSGRIRIIAKQRYMGDLENLDCMTKEQLLFQEWAWGNWTN